MTSGKQGGEMRCPFCGTITYVPTFSLPKLIIKPNRIVPKNEIRLSDEKGRCLVCQMRDKSIGEGEAAALGEAAKVLAENLASRLVDPPGADCSNYPKWGPGHTRTDRFEMRTRKWIAWALERANADLGIKV